MANGRTPVNWIDVSIPVRDGMVHWPGDPPVRIERVQDIDKGDSHTLSALSIGSHTGTHIDAPAHFIKGGGTVDRIPLDALMGIARIIEIKDRQEIKVKELEPYKIRRGQRILIKTRNSKLWDSHDFEKDFVFISPEGAEYMASRGVKLVGVDYLSVGGFKQGGRLQHKILLDAGVCIVEGLNLSNVTTGRYDFVCLPLRLQDGDGSPARAVVRKLPQGKAKLAP